MTADTPVTGHPRRGRPGRGPARGLRRALGVLIVLALAALIAAPGAEAATTAAATGQSAAGRVILAGPAPSPSPSASGPGIGLGVGAPTGSGTSPTPVTTTDPGTGSSSNPSWFDIPGQITKAIDDWFGSLIADALTPMLNLLGSTLLGTPDVTRMAGVQRIWTQMALLANALYVLLVLAGAVIVTTHGTAQSRYSAKEIVPRLAVGMIAGNASIAMMALMIHLADAIATALLVGTINPSTAGQALGNLLGGSAGNSIFLVLLDLGAQVMLIAILLTYIVRVALTVILAVAAPLVLMLHAIPGPDALARMWWRAVAGLFLIQLGQSLVFVVGLDVMLDPSANVNLLGLPNNSALVDTLVFLALCWILVKIPSWVGRSMLGTGGGSRLMGMAKAVIAYKTLGAFGLRKGPGGIPVRRKTGHPPNRPRPPAASGTVGGAGQRRPGPGPGAGGVVYRVTQMHPETSPARSAGAIGAVRPALPADSRAPAGRGPRLALEAGPSARQGGSETGPEPSAWPGPGTRYRQMTLPIKATRVPRPAPAKPPAPEKPDPSATGRARPRQVQRGLFPPPAKPHNPARRSAAGPGSAPSARMTAPPPPPPKPRRIPPEPAPNRPAQPPRMALAPPVPRPAPAPAPPPRPAAKPAPAAPRPTKEPR